MIDLYTWPTPNGHKVSIMLEEIGAQYRVFPIDIGNGQQFSPDYAAINPNGKIPAIIDNDAEGGPLAVFESGAILIYLATRAGAYFGAGTRGRITVIQWLMFQVGEIGPIFGQAQHFRRFAPVPVPDSAAYYTKEAARLYRVLDARLGEQPFVAGADYSIADIALWPWVARHAWQGADLGGYPNVANWFETVGGRPAVRRGMQVPRV
jgi:GST-like protein